MVSSSQSYSPWRVCYYVAHMKDLLKALVFGGLFIIPFLTLYVENDFFFPFITGKNFAFRIIVEVIFASWVLLSLYDNKYRPKFSWILAGFGAFLVVMFFADLFGEYPPKSFLSNFERMDGYMTLIHVFMYFVVAGSVLTTEKLWNYFLHTTIAVALIVAVYGLAQNAGMVEGARARVDSRLGNAAYMAIYMLFHIFFLFYLFVRSKVNVHRALYAIVIVIFIYTLLLTGTRGTFLGLVGGSIVAVAYIALFARRYPQVRKFATWGFVLLLVAGGVFYSSRDKLVEMSPTLGRVASIDLSRDLEVRSKIWAMAIEGVKERPILGWGQGNFNYVFNKNYNPELWHAESWFDRTHNIIFDWLIAGGFLGLIAYLSIFAGAFYYLFWQPLRTPKEEHKFSVLERGVIIGLLVAYFMHNLVVFDNIISYIFFGTLLALIHTREAKSIKAVEGWEIDERMINQFATPIVILLLGTTLYFAHAPGIGAAGDIIDALQQPTTDGRLMEFHSALERDSFGQQEIVEQLAQNAIGVVRNQNITNEEKQRYVQRAEQELKAMVEEKPGDARLHIFFSTFYRSVGLLPQAQEQAAIARSLSPNKQAIIIEQGIIEIQMGNNEAAKDFFKEAYELEETFSQARTYYAASLVTLGQLDEAKALLSEEKYMRMFASDDYALSVVDTSGDNELLREMFKYRIERYPNNAQNRASYAFLQYQNGDVEGAIETLEAAATDLPEFAARAQCFIGNLKSGKEPDEGC